MCMLLILRLQVDSIVKTIVFVLLPDKVPLLLYYFLSLLLFFCRFLVGALWLLNHWGLARFRLQEKRLLGLRNRNHLDFPTTSSLHQLNKYLQKTGKFSRILLQLKMSTESVNQYRMKIKKLKYKIQKQEQSYNKLKQQSQQFKAISKTQISLEKVLKKINFLLELKGLNIQDWINAVSYDTDANSGEVRISDLILVLDQMSIKLQAGQKSLLNNYTSQNMSDSTTRKGLIRFAQKYGIRTTSN